MSDILRKKKVLVVDDEPELRHLMTLLLTTKGCEVVQASGGREAMERFNESTFDAVLTDVRMPQGNGVELLTRIREVSPDRPVVLFVTGFADITDEEALQKGANAVIAKPFDVRHLISTVEKTLTGDAPAPAPCSPVRRQKRVSAEIEVELFWQAGGKPIPGKALNLSAGGMFVTFSEGPLNVGASLVFGFRSEAASTVPAGSGVVRWVRGPSTGSLVSGCGVEFVALSEPSRELVARLTAEQAKQR